MRTQIHTMLMTGFLLILPILNVAQTPDLKTCADFILFTSSGSITNTGVSQILGGAIGTNFGGLVGFDDVNVVKHVENDETIQAELDLQEVYDEIAAITPTATITAASLNGETITPGIYQIDTAVDLTIDLTLDAGDDPGALFIFKVTGAIDAAADIHVHLMNGASVNNIFWHGTAAIGAGAGASLKGTYMTNNGAIALGVGASLEGRALTVIGEVTMSGSTITGCIMPEATTVTLTQPTYEVATGTIEVTAPKGEGISYSIDGIDFTNISGLFTEVPGGKYTVTSKNSDGCISWTDVSLVSYVHVPTLGTAADFILFTSSGSITNTGVSQILGGAIGTDAGGITGFDDNVVKHINNDVTAQCKLDLQAVYDEISAIVPTATITAASLNGGTITPGIYQINEAVALTIDLTLDAQNNPDALFIFKMVGAFSTAASVNILLLNEASVNNVFWHGTAAIGAGASASLKGTFMTNAGAISLGAGASLEGRALTILGEVTIDGSTLTGCIMPEATTVTLTQPDCSVATGTIKVTEPLGDEYSYSIDGVDFTNTTGLFTLVAAGDYTVTSKNADGCISMTDITLTGFAHPPTLGTVTDFVLFTSVGDITNTGGASTTITGGAIGTHAGAITGYDDTVVEHIANDETLQCKADLQAAFEEIAAMPATKTITEADLSGQTVTAGVYHINSAATLAANLTLDAQGDTEAMFIFKVTGAFSVATNVHIILINEASAYNVFWNVDGAIDAGAGATMRGVFFALAGAISLGNGAKLEGRALTIAGAVTTNNSDVSVCLKPALPTVTLTQPNCSQATGSIKLTGGATGMTYRIDYCAFTNDSGEFTDVLAGTYLVTAKDSDGCISDSETVTINEESPPIIWIGSAGNAWNNIETWNLDEIPGLHCDVVIPDNGVVNITSNTTAVSKGLSIGTGAVLTIEAGNTLTVNEILTNNAGVGGLVLKDGGSLMHYTLDVPATMERLFDTAESWRLVSSPVIGQDIDDDWTPTGSYAGEHVYDFYAYDEARATWLNQKVGTNSINRFLSGKGYLVSFQVANQTKTFASNLHAGDVTIVVSNSGGNNYPGSNLIGNPYASGIDWNIADRSLFIDDFAYVYDRSSTQAGITEGYKTVDGNAPGAWIAPNQGFFVIKGAPGKENFSFTNAMRGHGGVFTKEASADEVLVLQLGNDSYYDQATLRIIDNAAFTRDRSDAMKFYSHNENMPQLYSYTFDQVKVAINSIPAIDQEKVITLGVRIPADGSYTLSASEISGRFQSIPLYLRNNKTGDIHNLRENPQYSFHAIKGDEPTLFEIWFTQPTDVSQLPAEDLTRIYTNGQTLYITFGREAPGRTLEVFNIIGKKLMHRSLGIGLQLTEQLTLQTGVYIVRVTDKDEVNTKRIYIE